MLRFFQNIPPVFRGGDDAEEVVLEAAEDHSRDGDPAAVGVQGEARLRDGEHLRAGRRRAQGVQGEQEQEARRHQQIPHSVARHTHVSSTHNFAISKKYLCR